MSGFEPRIPAAVRLIDLPRSYHNGAGNVTFAEGHVGQKRWLDERTVPPLLKGKNLFPVQSSPNNVDVLWLQERSTELKH